MRINLVVLMSLFCLITLSLQAMGESEFKDLNGPFLGQKPPGDTPELFAPGIISSGFHDRNITFSPDLNEIFFTRTSPCDWHSSIIYLNKVNGNWSEPELAPFITSTTDNASYPFISPDGRKVVFESEKQMDDSGRSLGGSLWFSLKDKKGKWGEAIPLPIPNRSMKESFPSVSANGNIYFYARTESNADADLFYYEFKNNQYEAAKKLGPGINTKNEEFHPYIAPDESYLIFDRFVYGVSHDLYISFKKDNGSWTEAINMGDTINTKSAEEIRPYVSPDGKYLFYVSKRVQDINYDLTYSAFMDRISLSGNNSHDIYWVDAKIIQELKKKVIPDYRNHSN